MVARSDLLADLGAEIEPVKVGDHVIGTAVKADANSSTTVPGVWVAGNISDLRAQVIVSAAEGLTAAAMINNDLVMEDARLATR
jgi:thioredoxin reductase (NADPH)